MLNIFDANLRVGKKAPDFALPSHIGGKVRLLDFGAKKMFFSLSIRWIGLQSEPIRCRLTNEIQSGSISWKLRF